MKFAEFSLHESILKAIAEERFHTATLVQQKVIPFVLAKKNVVVSAQTGTGKTAAFALRHSALSSYTPASCRDHSSSHACSRRRTHG